MSKDSHNPEIDLLILECVEFDYKPASEIAAEASVEVETVLSVLDELLEQGMAIQKKGLSYKFLSEDEEELD